jgi:hypothetical protein
VRLMCARVALQQCAAVRQCVAERAALCGSVWQCARQNVVAVCGSVWQCARQNVVAVCGSVWQCARQNVVAVRSTYMYAQSCSQYILYIAMAFIKIKHNK